MIKLKASKLTELANEVMFLQQKFCKWIITPTLNIIPFSMVLVWIKHSTILNVMMKVVRSARYPVCVRDRITFNEDTGIFSKYLHIFITVLNI